MNICSECGGVGGCEVGCAGPPKPKRINVAVNPETIEILERTTARDGITLTEAVRRLIGVGDTITTAAKVDHCRVLLQDGDGTREVVTL